MALSANTFFHFTSTREDVISIFENGFLPSYCLENFEMFTDHEETPPSPEYEIAIPVVCFCDIPISNLEIHTSNYGYFGVGLTKEWGKQNKLNPVMYINPVSHLSDELKNSLKTLSKNILNDKTDNPNEFKKLGANIDKIMCFSKPYKGQMIRYNRETGGYQYHKINFYNEREWRYIPKIEDSSIKLSLSKEEYKDFAFRSEENKKLSEYTLSFNIQDISYIIVKEELDIPWLISELRKIIRKKHNKQYSEGDFHLLCSKIFAIEKLNEDM